MTPRLALRHFSAWLATLPPRTTTTLVLGPVQVTVAQPVPVSPPEPSTLARFAKGSS